MKIKKIALFIPLVFLLIFVLSCSKSSKLEPSLKNQSSENQPIKILCTTAMVRDLVAEVGQEQIRIHTLIKGDLDPHSYELVKGDGEKFSEADLVFYNGLGLEHAPNIYKHLTEHPLSFSVGDYIIENNPSKLIYVDQQKDPHVWMDVSLWKEGVALVVNALSKQDPDHQTLYQQRGEDLYQQMSQMHEDIYAMLHEIPVEKRYLVTCHDAFNYFTKTYLAAEEEQSSEQWQERCKAPEGLAPDSQLSVADIKEVVTHLQKHQIEVVFPESNVNSNSILKIKEATKKMGMKLFVSPYVLYADSLGKEGEGQDTYLKMIRYNAEIITKCLKSKECYENQLRNSSKS